MSIFSILSDANFASAVVFQVSHGSVSLSVIICGEIS